MELWPRSAIDRHLFPVASADQLHLVLLAQILADLLAYASGIAVDQAWYLVSKANSPLDLVWSQGVASSRLERFINCPATINCQWQEN